MAKVVVKQKMLKTSGTDINEMNNMFQQMMGVVNADIDIILPKYVYIRNTITKFCKIHNILLNFKQFKDTFNEFSPKFEMLKSFIEEIKKDLNINLDIDDNELDYKEKSEEEINKLYKELREHKHVKTIIINCNNLIPFKRYLKCNELSTQSSGPKNIQIQNRNRNRSRSNSRNSRGSSGSRNSVDIKDDEKVNEIKEVKEEKSVNEFDDSFIKKEPGFELKPLTYFDIDLKYIWGLEKTTPCIKKFILTMLKNILEVSFTIYDTTTSPNVNIKKFSSALIDSINQMRERLPRCDKVFDIISNSVSLLENNFKNYYRSSVEASNPSHILESFIMDVANKQKPSAVLTGQFRQLISFIQKQQQNNTNPQVKALFKLLNSQMSAVDENKSEIEVYKSDDKKN
jgi:hypothetical protein